MTTTQNRIYDYSQPTRIGVWPVTVAEIADHLRIDSDVLATESAYLQMLIESATRTAELYTKRTFVMSEYTAWLDTFCQRMWFGNPYVFSIRRSPLITLDSIEYYKSGEDVLSLLDSAEYRVTQSPDFSIVYPVSNWPTDVDDRYHSIKFSFTAGYSDNTTPDPDESTVPVDIKNAIKQHVASLWSQRGDCTQNVSGQLADAISSGALPMYSKMVYNQNKIIDIYVGA